MAAPTTTWNRTYVMGQSITGRYEAPITPVNTTIKTTTAPTYASNASGSVLNLSPSSTGLHGGRVVFTATRDLSTYTYVGFQMQQYNWPFTSGGNGPSGIIDTFANGGIWIVFFDSSANWSEFYINGNDFTEYLQPNGGWAQFASAGTQGSFQVILERTRAADANSGTLDWANIDGFEFGINVLNTSASTPSLTVEAMHVFDPIVMTQGDSGDPGGFDTFSTASLASNSGYNMPDVYKDSAGNFNGNIGELYEPRYTYQIGDGVTATYFRGTGATICPYPLAGSGGATTPSMLLAAVDRGIEINQTATCDVVFPGEIFAAFDFAGGEDFINVSGNASGTCTFTSCQFFRKTYITLAHATATGGIFDDIEKLDINANTSLTGGVFRNSSRTSEGLYISGAAGNYSGIDLEFKTSNTGIDITAGSGGAGTYNLGGITVESGHQLNIWNPSTSNSVTVSIAGGISTQVIDLWFNYDNEASGPFTEGETLTFGNGATAKLVVLQDNGTTGTMYCELLTGSAPPDNNSITGGTSSATANVNEATGANNSTLNISAPATTVDITWAALLDNTRVRVYNNTQATEIDNSVVTGGSGYSLTITDGTEYDQGDTIVVLGTYQQAGVAKRVIRGTGVATTTDLVFTDSQVDWDDPGPNTLAIDGSTVSECTTDYINVEVEVSDPDDTTQKQRIAAFIVDAITTADGIRNWVSLAGDAAIRYSTNTAAEIDTTVAAISILNTKATGELLIQDSFEFDWSDGTDRVSTDTGPSTLWLAPARVLSFATGSGVTNQDKVDIANEVHNKTVENSESFIQTTRLMRAALAGESAVSGTTVTFRDAADAKDRITATVDSNGQRTSVTTDSS